MSASAAPELHNAHVAIVGLGLMGGSLALALGPHVRRLTAVELDRGTRQVARERDIVQVVTADLQEGVLEADVIVLATPVSVILHTLEQLPRLRSQECYVLDLGSTKRRICAAMDALPSHMAAIGGHPMCGKESSGLAFADEALYKGRTFVLCRTERTNAAMEELARAIVDVVGAAPLLMKAEEHDRLVALVSHLPYFVAALLMEQAAEAAERQAKLWSLSASGFRDTSRLAGSDPTMMHDIVRTNRGAILQVLRQYAGGLEALISLLEGEDHTALAAWLQARQEEHNRYRRAAESPAQNRRL